MSMPDITTVMSFANLQEHPPTQFAHKHRKFKFPMKRCTEIISAMKSIPGFIEFITAILRQIGNGDSYFNQNFVDPKNHLHKTLFHY